MMTEKEFQRIVEAEEASARVGRICILLFLLASFLGGFAWVTGFEIPQSVIHWGIWISVVMMVVVVLRMLLSSRAVKDVPEHEDDEDSEEQQSGDFKPVIPTSKPLIRMGIFMLFHGVMGYVLWAWFQHFIYPSLGYEGFIKSCLDFFLLLIVLLSGIDSWDSETLKLNEAGEILYFQRPCFTNVPSGLVCLGLPRWFGSTIAKVSFKKLNITVGLIGKDKKREDFIVECNGFRAIFDVAFEVSPFNTRLILQLEGSIEKRLVTIVNAAIFAVANSCDTDGNKKFPTIEKLKESTTIIEGLILSTTDIRRQLAVNGYLIHRINIKDIENEDKQIITATQAAQAQKFLEAAEMTSTKNTSAKTNRLWKEINRIGEEDEVPEKDRIPLSACLEIVQRAEKNIQTIQVQGGKGIFMGISPPSQKE